MYYLCSLVLDYKLSHCCSCYHNWYKVLANILFKFCWIIGGGIFVSRPTTVAIKMCEGLPGMLKEHTLHLNCKVNWKQFFPLKLTVHWCIQVLSFLSQHRCADSLFRCLNIFPSVLSKLLIEQQAICNVLSEGLLSNVLRKAITRQKI